MAGPYADMMRFIWSGIVLAGLACGGATVVFPQGPSQQTQKAKPKDQMFSGVVTAVDDASLTAVRTGPGTIADTKTFAITAETRFEGGKPQVHSRVTVRYVTAEDGERAIHVIVRGSHNQKK